MNVVIMGNGFNLAHGLKTSYNDFIDSETFKENLRNEYNFWTHYFQEVRELNSWINVEEKIYEEITRFQSVNGRFLLFNIKNYLNYINGFQYNSINKFQYKDIGNQYIDDMFKFTNDNFKYLDYIEKKFFDDIKNFYIENFKEKTKNQPDTKEYKDFLNIIQRLFRLEVEEEIKRICYKKIYDEYKNFYPADNYRDDVEIFIRDKMSSESCKPMIENINQFVKSKLKRFTSDVNFDDYMNLRPIGLYIKTFLKILFSTSRWNIENISDQLLNFAKVGEIEEKNEIEEIREKINEKKEDFSNLCYIVDILKSTLIRGYYKDVSGLVFCQGYKSSMSNFLYDELKDFTSLFQEYLEIEVFTKPKIEKLKTNNKWKFNEKKLRGGPNYFLNFNYIDTFFELYSSSYKGLYNRIRNIIFGNFRDINIHIHGSIEKNNIVIGTKFFSDIDSSIDSSFYKFRKYNQRQKLFDAITSYQELLENIKNNKGNINFHIIGHSLGKSDHKILKHLFEAKRDNIKIYIYYHNDEALEIYTKQITDIMESEDWVMDNVISIEQHDEKHGFLIEKKEEDRN